MKKISKWVFATVAALTLCALVSTPAFAFGRGFRDGGRFGGRGFHHGFGGPRFSFGFSYFYAPPVYYYPPAYYCPPAVVYSPSYCAPGPAYYYSGGCFYRY
jgi:hypothetical protein